MYVADTNFVSALRRPRKADAKVTAWAQTVPVARIYLSVITLLELELGTLLVEKEDRAQGKILRTWLDDVIVPAFAGRMLPVDEAVTRRCACLHADRTRSQHDALIAATALVHSMIVITRNVADFAIPGLNVVNPWEQGNPDAG